MIKIFIYYEKQNKWVEESSHLLYHDLAAFIDDNLKTIYLWNGPKSTKERLKKGSEDLSKLLKSFPEIKFQIKTLNKNIPSQVKSHLEKLLEVAKTEQEVTEYQYSHFFTIRIHSLLSVISLTLPIITLIILNSSLFWEHDGSNFLISNENYHNWIILSFSMVLICLLLFIPQLLVAIYEYDTSMIVISSVSIIINISLLAYLQQGIFLFQFQPQSSQTLYYIAKMDIYIFLLLIFSAILLFEIPNFIRTINFLTIYKKFIF